jgi:hypothetical protein
MGSIDEHNFSAPPEVVSAHGLLFDFDGKTSHPTYAMAWCSKSLLTEEKALL